MIEEVIINLEVVDGEGNGTMDNVSPLNHSLVQHVKNIVRLQLQTIINE